MALPGRYEADETFVGGKAKNMHKWQREKLTGRGGTDKVAVVGVRDRATKRVRATVIGKVQAPMLRGFVVKHTVEGATVYTDGESAYEGMANHDSRKAFRSVSTSAGRSTRTAWRASGAC